MAIKETLDRIVAGLEEIRLLIELARTEPISPDRIIATTIQDLFPGTATVPTGGIFIGLFNTSCPNGWTRVTAYDDATIRGSSSYGGTGGESGATMPSHSHGAGSYSTDSKGSHTHSESTTTISGTAAEGLQPLYIGSSGNTGSAGAHSHDISGTSGAASHGSDTNWPPYVETVICSRD